MFDSVRKHQRVLLFVLILLVFPAFAFFGIQGYDRFFSAGTEVAKVNGEPIQRAEFDESHREQLERMRQMFGGSIDPRMLDTPQLRAQVLENLIAQRVMAQHARDSRIVVSDARLREAIVAIPGLIGEDGRFDMARYRSLVAARGRSEAGFEFELRRDLAMQALPNAVQDSAWVPAPVMDRVLRALGEKREVREQRFDPARLTNDIRLSDEALKAFYEQSQSKYQQPETVAVQYVVLDGETLAANVEVKPEEVSSFYAQNQKRYATSEERSAAHILLRLDPKANDAERGAVRQRVQQLLDQLIAGADFSELARTRSEDPGSATQGGDLGYFTRDLMVKPFADATFEMKPGETRGPIETEFGLHIVRLTGIREARIRPLDEVKGEIETEIRRTIAARKFAENAEAFTNTAFEQPDTLDPLSKRFGTPVRVQEALPRGGSPELGRDHPLNHPKVLSALFSTESIRDRRNIEAVEQGGRIITARVTAHQPARQRSFEEVREEVQAAATRAEALKLARAQGEKLLAGLKEHVAALKSGRTDSPAPPEANLSEPQVLSRVEQSSVPQAAVEAIFKSPSQGLPMVVGVDLGDGGYAVYQFTRVIEADEEILKGLRASTSEAVERAGAEQELRDYLESRKAQAEVVRSLSRIAPAQR